MEHGIALARCKSNPGCQEPNCHPCKPARFHSLTWMEGRQDGRVNLPSTPQQILGTAGLVVCSCYGYILPAHSHMAAGVLLAAPAAL